MATKGLMISERPPPSVVSGGSSLTVGGGGGGGGPPSSMPGVKIGNYKGVMLCNRPFAGVAATSKAAQKGGPAPFVTGIPTDKVGTSIPIHHKTRKHPRSKKHTALSRHKKWLRELQATKDKLEAEMIADEDAKEDRKQRFMERERQMRQAVRGLEGSDVEDTDYDEKAGDNGDDGASGGGAGDAGRSDDGASQSKAEAKQRTEESTRPEQEDKVDRSRPMWAMTEEKAEQAEEDKEEEEAERLLDFAANLDFDKYIDDMEVRAMMEQVKNTVDDLESAIADEEKQEQAAEAKAAEAEARDDSATGAADAKLTADKLERLNMDDADDEGVRKLNVDVDADDDARSVATSILSQASDLRAVHSKKSMAALAEQARGRIQTGRRLESVPEDQPPAPKLKVVVHNEDPMRLKKALDPSNLPYMHRNPAV